MKRHAYALIGAAVLSLTPLSCGDPLDPPVNPPPAAVNDLRIAFVAQKAIALRWTATGEDGRIGQAKGYDIRYSEAEITSENFRDAISAELKGLSPSPAGQEDSIRIMGLIPSTTYYFGLTVVDRNGNESQLSNTPSGTTLDAEDLRK